MRRICSLASGAVLAGIAAVIAIPHSANAVVVACNQCYLELESLSSNHGTGFGNTLNILSLQTENGQTVDEIGSIAFNDVTTQDATNQSDARTLQELLLTNAADFH